jgi:glycosyltransferase involved in cell wall biosynthesis
MKHLKSSNSKIIIVEDISFPIDEGIKKYSFNIASFFSNQKEGVVYTHQNNNDLNKQYQLTRNKLFLSRPFLKSLKNRNGNVVYVPNSSSTFASFLRLKIVKFFTKKKTVLISLQKRNHSNWQRKIISIFLKPDLLFVFSEREKDYYASLKIKTEITSVGVNVEKFNEVTQENKTKLRAKLGLSLDKKIVCHVGHINEGRNIKILKELVALNYEVVIIGSTCFDDDETLKNELKAAGVKVVTDYIESICEYYQVLDAYIFPVLNDNSVIEFPLSILEAMSCNIPVLSTAFGSIPHYFKESDDFKYFNTKEELIFKMDELFAQNNLDKCMNRERIVKDFTWVSQFEKLNDRIIN